MRHLLAIAAVVAISVTVAALATGATGAPRPATGCAGPRHVGAVTAVGCWKRSGSVWLARTPVKLNGMTLAGRGSVVVDEKRGIIKSTGRVRWRFGDVQIRRAAFAWKRGAPISLEPAGRLRGLPFSGNGTITFTRAKGGTTQLVTQVSVPLGGGGLTGDAVVTVSRKGGFDFRRVHVRVPQAPFTNLVFRKLDFGYDALGSRWSGSGEATLPAFATGDFTIAGSIALANGRIVNVGVGADGLRIPLAEGFFLTGAALTVDLDPFGLSGQATATFGPPLGSAAALELEGRGAYDARPERWTASGKVTLPWVPMFTPSVEGSVTLHPGRAMTFDANADLTIRGWGVKSHIEGFVSRRAFNAEGDATLDIPGPNLKGAGLFSSKGMAACGKFFLGPRIGFGYSWGGGVDFMHSSCDVGRWRVPKALGAARSAQLGPQTVTVPSGLPFEVFAVRGTDFTVTGPSGTVASTPDRDGPDAFATHDADGWAYVVVPIPPAGQYAVVPIGAGTIEEFNVADGLIDPTITGSVSGGTAFRTLQYDINGLVPGETVSFYQGVSASTAGAEPIAEDVATNGPGSVRFEPEPLGQSTRYVFAVVSIEGRPRLQQQVASFDSTEAAEPATFVRIYRDPQDRGWIVNYAQSERVARWEALVGELTDEFRNAETIVPKFPYQRFFRAARDAHLRVEMTPYDGFGRAGTTVVCDSAKPGPCAAA
jgi:hypothetical protein